MIVPVRRPMHEHTSTLLHILTISELLVGVVSISARINERHCCTESHTYNMGKILVSKFLGFSVSKFLGFKVPKFLGFKLSKIQQISRCFNEIGSRILNFNCMFSERY